MKLTELATPKKSRQVTRVFESYFGTKMPVNRLTVREAQAMLKRVRGVIAEHQRSPSRHTSERNPAYLKLVMMEQALTSRIQEEQVPIPPTSSSTNPSTSTATTPPPSGSQNTVDIKDPKMAQALKKSAAGQTLTPDEQKMVAGQAMMAAESRLRRAYRYLKESEVQQAQVVLAAQDMVDKMQSMLEDTTEMQFKELPALVDSIRNQIGMDQATQFNSDVTGALQGLVQNLQGAKQQLETALGVVTGQPAALDTSMAASGMPGAAPAPMPGAEMGADIGADVGADVGAEMGTDIGADLETGAPAPKAALGRARR
jgi:hypothetical protein